MMEKLGILMCILLVLCEIWLGRFVVKKNSLRVTTSNSLKNYEYAIGKFGAPDYRGTLSGSIRYPKSNRQTCSYFTEQAGQKRVRLGKEGGGARIYGRPQTQVVCPKLSPYKPREQVRSFGDLQVIKKRNMQGHYSTPKAKYRKIANLNHIMANSDCGVAGHEAYQFGVDQNLRHGLQIATMGAGYGELGTFSGLMSIEFWEMSKQAKDSGNISWRMNVKEHMNYNKEEVEVQGIRIEVLDNVGAWSGMINAGDRWGKDGGFVATDSRKSAAGAREESRGKGK